LLLTLNRIHFGDSSRLAYMCCEQDSVRDNTEFMR
jgi:hypothetical protein